jgi:hypothetical protein
MRIPEHDRRYARTVADVLPDAARSADWRPVRVVYRQARSIVAGPVPATPPLELLERLAEELDRIATSYSGREEHLCLHLLAVLADEDGHEVIDDRLVRQYYTDRSLRGDPPRTARRAPAVLEAAVETCRRVIDARRIGVALRGTGTSGLLCGSANYGRFLNVRGGDDDTDPSDLDLIVALPDVGSLATVVEHLRAVAAIEPADLDRLDRRRTVFVRDLDDGRTTFSHKLRLRTAPMLPGDPVAPTYRLSLHLVTRPVLDYLLVTSSPRLIEDAIGSRRTITDYRETPTDRRDEQRTFTGRTHYLESTVRPAEAGLLRSTGVYSVDAAGHYSPGFFQTMLLPQPETLWDEMNIQPELADFRRKIAERVRHEREANPFALILPSLAHLRLGIFAPRVIAFLDEGYTRR